MDPDIFQKGPSHGDAGPPVGSRGKAPVGSVGGQSPPEAEANVKYMCTLFNDFLEQF